MAQRPVLAEPPQHARGTVPRPAARPCRAGSGRLRGPAAEVAFATALTAEKRLNDRYLGTAGKMTRPQKPSQTASKYPPPLPDSTPPEPDAHLMSSLPPVALLTGARPGKRGGGAPQKFRGGALRQPFLAGSCPKPERCGVCGGNRWGCGNRSNSSKHSTTELHPVFYSFVYLLACLLV